MTPIEMRSRRESDTLPDDNLKEAYEQELDQFRRFFLLNRSGFDVTKARYTRADLPPEELCDQRVLEEKEKELDALRTRNFRSLFELTPDQEALSTNIQKRREAIALRAALIKLIELDERIREQAAAAGIAPKPCCLVQ